MQRRGIYSIPTVFTALGNKIHEFGAKVELDGEMINADSDRYRLFQRDGCKCCRCGLEGQYFAMERSGKGEPYHMNLYGTKNGQEILFTKDHILPKSKGGTNTMDNYQVMCRICNEKKADTIEKE